jgi:hypothetical protein
LNTVGVFPQKVTNAIAFLEKEQYTGVAKTWLQKDEIKLDGWNAEDAELFISQLLEYAKKSKSSSKRLFLGFSL